MDRARVQGGLDVLDTAFEISRILDTGLDKEELAILIALIENGANPEASIQSRTTIAMAYLDWA